MDPQFAPRTPARTVAAAVVGLEAAALTLATVLYLVFGIVGEGDSRQVSFGMAALAGVGAVGLGLLARGLWNARRWATSPSLTWQVLQGLVGAYAISAGLWALGAALLAVALVGLVSLALVARSAPPSGI